MTTETDNPKKNDDQEATRRKGVLMRGLFMFAFLILTNIATTVLAVIAIIQFFWMLFKGERNEGLTNFGKSLGKWLHEVVRFQTVESDTKPFPWAEWPSEQG